MKPAGSLAPTLIFGFAAHIAVAVIGVVVVPIYLNLLGPEGYGLAGFYVVLQSWMLLFDLGLSPAVARQLSRYRAGAVGEPQAASLLKAAEVVFLVIGIAAAAVFVLAAGWVMRHWLGPSRLPPHEIVLALRLLGCLLVLRWMTGFYQSALVGLEHQNSVNAVALIGALVRTGVAVAALLFISRSPVTFFAAQAIMTVAEAGASRVLLAIAAPTTTTGARAGWGLLSGELRFAIGLAAAAAVATLINQADKLTLSHIMPLADFGAFSLVVTICSGIGIVIPPFVQAFQPRLTGLLAQGRQPEFAHIYRVAAALIIVLSAALAGTVAAQPEMVLYAWTGDRNLAERLAPVLTLYALGTGIGSFLFVPYLLQYAQGKIRLHLIGNLLFATVWVPATIWAAYVFGSIGTGATWLCGNLLFAALWVPFVHRRLLSREERKGLGWGAVWRVALLGAALTATRIVDFNALGRLESLVVLGIAAAAPIGLGLCIFGELRATILGLLSRQGSHK